MILIYNYIYNVWLSNIQNTILNIGLQNLRKYTNTIATIFIEAMITIKAII